MRLILILTALLAFQSAAASEVDEMKAAAEQGKIVAQFNMGVSYDFALGIAENDSEAASWYLKAANQGLAEAQYNLGVLYRQGSGVTQSDEEALKWYLKSGHQGNANAQTNLGFMYSNGLGVSVQDIEAIKWYRLKKIGLNNRHVSPLFKP